jgi:Transposase IS116/IS110/IS902 family
MSSESLFAAARYALYRPGHLEPSPLRGLSEVICPTPAQQIVFQEYVRAVTEHTARLQRLEQARQDQVQTWQLQPGVEALQGLRGVQFTAAVTTVAELGDLTRCEHPRQLMKYLGLIPSAYSGGERRRQGSITKAGNTHAWRALVEGAWAYRYPAKVSRHLQLRLEAPQSRTRHQLEGASTARQTLPTAERTGETRESSRGGYRQGTHRPYVGHRQRGPCDTLARPNRPGVEQHSIPSEGARPRCGVTLDGVKRPAGILAPRWRQAPDGPK